MKPASFEYTAPATTADAVALLCGHPEAKIIAGGQSLVPMMNFRLARPELLVDIGRIDGLRYVRRDGDWLAVGALTTEHTVGTSAAVAAACPVLTEATRWIGHQAIRHRGTIGGSVAHSDPSAEYPLVGTLLDAVVVTEGAEGTREIPFGEFCVGHFTTALGDAELITELRFPALAPGTGWAFAEVARRAGDFALVSVGVTLRMAGNSVTEARIALGGVGPAPVRATRAESLLRGQRVSDALIEAAAAEAAATVSPPSDMHGSADFRRQLCRVLTARGLREAQRNVHV